MCSLQLCHPARWNSKLSEVLQLATKMSENPGRNYSIYLFATFLVCLSGFTLTSISNLFIYFAIYLLKSFYNPLQSPTHCHYIHVTTPKQCHKTLDYTKKHQKLGFFPVDKLVYQSRLVYLAEKSELLRNMFSGRKWQDPSIYYHFLPPHKQHELTKPIKMTWKPKLKFRPRPWFWSWNNLAQDQE